MSKRAAQQRFIAWLALAAMGLIVLMPAISRTMPMDGPMPGMSTAASEVCEHHAGHHAGMPAHPDDPTARCGYCVLFAHTPLAAFDAPVLLLSAPPSSFSLRAAWPRAIPAAPLLSARPRGPPSSVDA